MAVRTKITFNELPIEASNALSLDNVNRLIANLGQRGLASQPLGREAFRQAQLPSLQKALRASAFIEEDRAKLLRAAEENQNRLSRNAAIREQQRLRDIASKPVIESGVAHQVGFGQQEQRQVNVRLPSGQSRNILLDRIAPSKAPGIPGGLMPTQNMSDLNLINQSIVDPNFKFNRGVGFGNTQQKPKSTLAGNISVNPIRNIASNSGRTRLR